MNEEFKEGLNQEAQQQVCTDLREIISDILHARDNFRTFTFKSKEPRFILTLFFLAKSFAIFKTGQVF